MTISPVVDSLIAVFEEEKPKPHEGLRLSVSRTISILAVLYEKARNAVEFRAEHLVRRAAIERILKRRLILNGGSQSIAENLVVELLWARYIDSSLLDDAKVTHIQLIIDRAITTIDLLQKERNLPKGINRDAVLGFISAEIEETMVSGKKREALNNFFYQSIRDSVKIPRVDERTVTLQTYITVERAFAKSDDALITYHLLLMLFPTWFTSPSDSVRTSFAELLQNLRDITDNLRNPIGEPLHLYVRRHTPPYLLIRDFFFETGSTAREFIENTDKFEQKLSEIADKRYQEIGAKVRRAVVRSIIYIFLTKMVFALALEAPFDIFITHSIAYLPLAINTLFPPILMFLVAGFISIPGSENTKRLTGTIIRIFYSFDDMKKGLDPFISKVRIRRPLLSAVFTGIYLLTFILSFGFIGYILTLLHFNVVSQTIFIFFVTLVTFFAYRIRQSAKEYEMIENQGFLSPLMDFFLLPVIRVGHFLSREIAKLNIFIFFFDFILEAPLKVIFEVVEEWIRFIRTKKDEIL